MWCSTRYVRHAMFSPLIPEAPETLQSIHWLGAESSESDVAATGNQWTITHGPRSKTHYINLRKSKPWTHVSATRLQKSLTNPWYENKPLCLSWWPSAQSLLAISLTSALKWSVQASMQAQPYWWHYMDKLVTDQTACFVPTFACLPRLPISHASDWRGWLCCLSVLESTAKGVFLIKYVSAEFQPACCRPLRPLGSAAGGRLQHPLSGTEAAV